MKGLTSLRGAGVCGGSSVGGEIEEISQLHGVLSDLFLFVGSSNLGHSVKTHFDEPNTKSFITMALCARSRMLTV